eukprot:Anaeramoba_flamelloidesc36719_g1_i2.p1 GENE.c36719_g1_i2~~c36719_g1_i2.p1  ORF type:complete len:206 (+),score=59.42 c36719_g1_i2:29-646(+)
MTNNEAKNEHLIKIQLVGNSGVGKTSLLAVFNEKEFELNNSTTHGVEFETKEITLGEKTVIAQIWDTGGQEAYRSIPKQYYRNSHGYLFVYDITDYKSFKEIASWQEDIFEICKPKAQFLLIGNKKDMEDDREVTTEEGKNYAKENNMSFLETSAKDNLNVEKAFIQVLEQCVENNIFDVLQATNDEKDSAKSGGLVLNDDDEKK